MKCFGQQQNSLDLKQKTKLHMVSKIPNFNQNSFTLKKPNAELVYRISFNYLVAKETLEGHQRAMMGNMTVEEIYRERKTFSNAVFDVSKKDFVKFGMSIISYTLKDITDEVGYLKVS